MKRFSILVVVIFLSFFPALAQKGEIIWSKATAWGEIRVRQEGDVRILAFADEDGETEESRMLLSAPNELQARYLRQMLRAAHYVSGPDSRYLVVGMGAGSLSKALAHDFPEAVVTSIELEPAVVDAARKFFGYQDSDRLITVIDDARHFLESTDGKYDAIFLDAFDGVDVPEPLRTVEFARLLDEHLKPDGAVIANVHFVPQEPSLRYQASLMEVFADRYLTNGLAQGVGIFSHRKRSEVLKFVGTPHSRDAELMAPAPPQPVEGAAPYFDAKP